MSVTDVLLYGLVLFVMVPVLIYIYVWFAMRAFFMAKRTTEEENRDGSR